MLSATGGHQVGLAEGRGGVFEIRRDGEPVYSKKLSGRFPSDAELQALTAR
ncbi:MAG: Rdx family protein [Proteobacteria bacterium]|nr:Rdx family protein [Pseudomonadota bacterium]